MGQTVALPHRGWTEEKNRKRDVLWPHHLTARGLILRRSLISLSFYIQTWAFGLWKRSGPRRKI